MHHNVFMDFWTPGYDKFYLSDKQYLPMILEVMYEISSSPLV